MIFGDFQAAPHFAARARIIERKSLQEGKNGETATDGQVSCALAGAVAGAAKRFLYTIQASFSDSFL